MNDEVKKWLSNNLTIEIDTENDWSEERLVVRLLLEDEEISRDSIQLSRLK